MKIVIVLSNCAMQPRVDALQIILSGHVSSKIPQDRSSGVPNGRMIQVQIFSHPLGMDDDENLLLLL